MSIENDLFSVSIEIENKSLKNYNNECYKEV